MAHRAAQGRQHRLRSEEQARHAEYEEYAERNNIPVYRSAGEVWAAYPDACRDCDEPKPPPPGALYGWVMWVACGWPACRFGHAHHGDEVLIGGYRGRGWPADAWTATSGTGADFPRRRPVARCSVNPRRSG